MWKDDGIKRLNILSKPVRENMNYERVLSPEVPSDCFPHLGIDHVHAIDYAKNIPRAIHISRECVYLTALIQ
jgi:hypothetical protein